MEDKELTSIAEGMLRDMEATQERNRELEEALGVILDDVEKLLEVFPRGTENYRATEALISYINKVLESEDA